MANPTTTGADQSKYWSAVAETKAFSHPLPADWLDGAGSGPALDIGCGYGRSVRELLELGVAPVAGVDTAAGMIERGLREHPELDLRHVPAGATLPYDDGHFATALLFAVLTCIPLDEHQRALLAEARRVLRPGGQLIVSDLPLQSGERERARYELGAEEHGTYGVFSLPDRGVGGGVVRHHDEACFASYATPDTGFHLADRRELDTVTMNGNPCRIVQLRLIRLP